MKKILIIEDDPIVAHIYRTRLEKEGFALDTCADGQSGFYRIHDYKPDAVLLDLMLPKMNGIDILKKIRAQTQFARVPIVVFTNAYVPNMIQEAFSSGASQVFNKATLTPRQIIDALHTLIHGTSEERAPGTPAADTEAEDAAAAAGEDAATVGEASRAFITALPEGLTGMRRHMQDFSKAQSDEARIPHLLELYRKVHALTGSAGLAGYTNIAQMAAAVEVLLKELYEKPKNINASTIRTVAHSIDFIAELSKQLETDASEAPPVNILVVDDEILSRRAITYALEKASLKAVSVEDPSVALNLATEHRYDLVFLDVQMPGMDGFELCTRIRATTTNKTTPVIFVTSLTDFKSRAKSSLSGGTDLIAKPFMFIELSVKALTHVLRGRLQQRRQVA